MAKPHGTQRVTGRRAGLLLAVLSASLVFPSTAIALSGPSDTPRATPAADLMALVAARRAPDILDTPTISLPFVPAAGVSGRGRDLPVAVEPRPAPAVAAVAKPSTTPKPRTSPAPAPAAKPSPKPAKPKPSPTSKRSVAPKASPAAKPVRKTLPRPAAPTKPTTKPKAPAPVAKPAPKPAPKATPRFSGRNAFWYPQLGISERVYAFPCERSRPPDAPVYRWGCAGSGNVYLLAHAATKFRPLNAAYYAKTLKPGQLAVYADSTGKVRYYRLAWMKVAPPTTGASWAWAAQSRSSMTLQTCVGPNDSLRLFVRFLEVSKP